MHSVSTLQQLLENELQKIQFPGHPKDLYDPIRYMLSVGGKRLRPALVMMGCEMFEGKINDALPAALGIEVFHNFTLMHDDIMDKAPLRRSKATVHEKWNSDIAILSGDTMFVKAYQLILSVDDKYLRSVISVFTQTAAEVCEGQQMDMSFENDHSVSITDYLRMIELKTAVLLGCALQIGATIAGANNKDAKHLYEFGKHLGIAFQLQDDLLDVYGDSKKFGKQTGGDILSNKKTFLLLKAQELSNALQRQTLNQWMTVNISGSEQQKITEVKGIFDTLDIPLLAKMEMENHYNNALHHLDAIKINANNKTILKEFAEQLMVREV